MKGVYTPAKEIREYHYHKNRVRVSQWVRFFTLIALLVVTVIFLITNKDAYTVQTTINSVWEKLGSMQQEYTYLATSQDASELHELLNKLYVIAGNIFKTQAVTAILLTILGIIYVDSSGSLSESKRLLEGSKTE